MSNYPRILSICEIKNKLNCNKRDVTKVTIIWMNFSGFQFLYMNMRMSKFKNIPVYKKKNIPSIAMMVCSSF